MARVKPRNVDSLTPEELEARRVKDRERYQRRKARETYNPEAETVGHTGGYTAFLRSPEHEHSRKLTAERRRKQAPGKQ